MKGMAKERARERKRKKNLKSYYSRVSKMRFYYISMLKFLRFRRRKRERGKLWRRKAQQKREQEREKEKENIKKL